MGVGIIMELPVLRTWVLIVGDLNFNKTIVVEFFSQVPQCIGFYVEWNTYYTTIISTIIGIQYNNYYESKNVKQ